jgi:hypothetical protein
MKTSERENYIKYRLGKATETLDDAALLIDNQKWNSAINRLYYAAYYAISALLTRDELNTKTHNGVKTQFFLNYVKTGIFSLEMGKLYADLFDWRQKGDYSDFFDFTAADVIPQFEPTKSLIDAIIWELDGK